MIIIPAIDLKDGNCVRLLKGEEGTETIFSNNPSDTAKRWERSGAEWVHVVDLDGAFRGNPKNFEAVEEVVRSVSSNVQVGGGIRNIATVEKYLEVGVKRVIIGTAAFTDRDFLKDICQRFPGKIAVGIDTKGGRIALRGWKQTIDTSIAQTMLELHDIGVSLVIHTNVDRDGTMEGIDAESVKSFLSLCPLPVIVSGGIASLADLSKIQSIGNDNLLGAILGKSLYSGSIDLKDSIQRFQ